MSSQLLWHRAWTVTNLAGHRAVEGQETPGLAPLVYNQDHLAELRAGLQVFVREPAFGQWKGAVEDRFQPSGGHQLEHGGKFGFGTHVGAQDGKLAAEEEP